MTDTPNWLVYVPGLSSSEASTEGLRHRLVRDLEGPWEARYWEHGLRPWTRGSMSTLARSLHVQLSTWFHEAERAGRTPEQIMLVGHSIGAILARDAFLMGQVTSGVDTGNVRSPWADRVRRIVLLAAPNRGYRTDRMPWWLRPAHAAAAAFTALVVEDIRSGAPYLADLRIRWIDHFRGTEVDRPTVVQVLGDRDWLVYEDDSFDVTYMQDSVQLRAPRTGHSDIVDATGEDGRGRYPVVLRAARDDFAGTAAAKPAARPLDRSVFLLHGIRGSAYADWVTDLGDELREQCDKEINVVTPDYGYLTAVGFAVPLVRRRQVRILLDEYVRAYVRTGTGGLSFGGHSNGTYILGSALAQVPGMWFHRIFLAGSVLPREYPWDRVIARKQVRDRAEVNGLIHNDRGRHDVPVGWLCSALHGLGMDVGTGGFENFTANHPQLVQHERWLPHGHGAAFMKQKGHSPHPGIAAFLLGGEFDESHDVECSPGFGFEQMSRFLGVVSPVAVGYVLVATARWMARGPVRKRVGLVAIATNAAWAIGSSV